MWKFMSKVESSQANVCVEGEIAIVEGWGEVQPRHTANMQLVFQFFQLNSSLQYLCLDVDMGLVFEGREGRVEVEGEGGNFASKCVC